MSDDSEPIYTVGLLGVRVTRETMDAGVATNLRLNEIEQRILALEACIGPNYVAKFRK